MIDDGRLIAAKDIFKQLSPLGRPIKNSDNEVVYDVSKCGLRVLSLNKNNMKLESKEIRLIWKLKTSEELFNVELDSGLSVATTPEHLFLTFDGKDIKEVPAEHLREGQFIICARTVNYNPASIEEMKREIMLKLSGRQEFIVKLNDIFASEIKSRIMDIGIEEVWKSIATHYKKKDFYSSCIYHGRYRLRDIVALCKYFEVGLDRLYDSIENITYRKSLKKHGKLSTRMKLPKSEKGFSELLYAIGLIFGDGCRTFITNNNEHLQKRFLYIMKMLGFRPTVEKRANRATNVLSNGGMTFLNFMIEVFDYPIKDKTKSIRISEFIEMLDKRFIASFLRGYFDADGTIERGRSAISITSMSNRMLKDLQLLLLRFGCQSTLNKDTLYISGQSARMFAYRIGFSTDGKISRMNKLVGKAKSSKNTDVVPVDASLLSFAGSRFRGYRVGDLTATSFSLQSMTEGIEYVPSTIKKIMDGDVSFVKVKSIERTRENEVFDFTIPDNHNFIAEGMIIHNTCLTDNLAAAAGMMARDLVGERMLTWIDEQERERLMTIYGATVTMAHEYEGEKYLINLLDTPGHVDFGADVTQAMRAVDGGVVLVCAVEGIMPQTETVLKQALAERVKPVLFINKVDRAIKELKLTPEALQKRLARIVVNVNKFIQRHVEEQYRDKWVVKVEDGSVAFGSALRKWAISIPAMKKFNVTFKDIIELCAAGKDEELANRAPMNIVVMDMVVKHLPAPTEAQRYRIEKVWKGDPESEVGKQLMSCDPDGKLAAAITKVVYDPHAGMISTARIFSGKLRKGETVYLHDLGRQAKIQQVTTFIADKRIPVEVTPAGNIVGLVGLTEAIVGETMCDPEFIIEPFEAITHIFEPVVTKAIEPKSPQDLPKLIDILKTLNREDPTLRIKINPETGETLVSGLGELHLDAKVERKIKEKGIEIHASPPIVVYRETVTGTSPEIEGKSPNKHNRFYISVEPMPAEIYRAMMEGVIKDADIKGKKVEILKELEKVGMSRDDAKNTKIIHNHCIFIDDTKGIQYLNEAMELIKDAFKRAVDEGPQAKEPCAAIIVRLTDASLHEDAVHRGPAQVMPAVRIAIHEAMLKGGTGMLEPKQILRIDTPQDYIGNVSGEVNNRRGEIMNIEQEEFSSVLTVKLPVAEMFGFEGQLKSATGGKGFQSLMDVVFEKVPKDLVPQVVGRIRDRKGLPRELTRV